jgi:hypothetical protein
MARTIAALYDSRAEAEFARTRLVSRVKARSPRIIGKDTIGALDGLDIDSSDKDFYRDKVRDGGHLLVAQAPSGVEADRIIALLEDAVGHADLRADSSVGVRVEFPSEHEPHDRQGTDSTDGLVANRREREAAAPAMEHRTDAAVGAPQNNVPLRERRPPWLQQEALATGNPPAAGARVRAFAHEVPVEQQVTLRDEVVTVDNRLSGKSLSDSEVAAAGLFKERVIEIAEMREEPVITKVAVMREEVIVRKTVKERNETIRETLRQTQIEVEDFPASDAPDSLFFGQGRSERPNRA